MDGVQEEIAKAEAEAAAAKDKGRGGSSERKKMSWLARTWRSIACQSIEAPSGEDDTDAYGLTPPQRARFAAAVPVVDEKIKTLMGGKRWGEAADACATAARCHALLGDRKLAAGRYNDAATCVLNEAERRAGRANAVRSSATFTLARLFSSSTPAGPASIPSGVGGADDSVTQDELNTLLRRSVAHREQAIEQTSIAGLYREQAKYAEELSKFLRHDTLATHDKARAVALLKDAARLHGHAGNHYGATTCLADVAREYQREARYEEAAELWRCCVEYCVEETLMKGVAIKHALSEMLCHTATYVYWAVDKAASPGTRGEKSKGEGSGNPGSRPGDSDGDHDSDGDDALRVAGDAHVERLEDKLEDLQYLDPQITPLRTERILIAALIAACAEAPPPRPPAAVAVVDAIEVYTRTNTFDAHQLEVVRAIQGALEAAAKVKAKAEGKAGKTGLLRFFQ